MKRFKTNDKVVYLNYNNLGIKSIELTEKYLLLNNHGYNININTDMTKSLIEIPYEEIESGNIEKYYTDTVSVYIEFYGKYLNGGKTVENVQKSDVQKTIKKMIKKMNKDAQKIVNCNHEFIKDSRDRTKGHVKCLKCNVSGLYAPFYTQHLTDEKHRLTKHEKNESINIDETFDNIDYMFDINYSVNNEDSDNTEKLIVYGLSYGKGTTIVNKTIKFKNVSLMNLTTYLSNRLRYYDSIENLYIVHYVFINSVKIMKSKEKLNYNNIISFFYGTLECLNSIIGNSEDSENCQKMLEKRIHDYFDDIKIGNDETKNFKLLTNDLDNIAANALIQSVHNFINN